MATTKKSEPDVTPAGQPDESAVKAAEAAKIPVTPAPDESQVPLGDAEKLPDADKPVTMKDIAALQGIGAGPDASIINAVSEREAHEAGVFISAGMKSDLDSVGWCKSPVDGTVIASADMLKRAREARKENAEK